MKILPITCSPFLDKTKIKLLLQRVSLVPSQEAFTLKAADDNSRTDAYGLREVVHPESA